MVLMKDTIEIPLNQGIDDNLSKIIDRNSAILNKNVIFKEDGTSKVRPKFARIKASSTKYSNFSQKNQTLGAGTYLNNELDTYSYNPLHYDFQPFNFGIKGIAMVENETFKVSIFKSATNVVITGSYDKLDTYQIQYFNKITQDSKTATIQGINLIAKKTEQGHIVIGYLTPFPISGTTPALIFIVISANNIANPIVQFQSTTTSGNMNIAFDWDIVDGPNPGGSQKFYIFYAAYDSLGFLLNKINYITVVTGNTVTLTESGATIQNALSPTNRGAKIKVFKILNHDGTYSYSIMNMYLGHSTSEFRIAPYNIAFTNAGTLSETITFNPRPPLNINNQYFWTEFNVSSLWDLDSYLRKWTCTLVPIQNNTVNNEQRFRTDKFYLYLMIEVLGVENKPEVFIFGADDQTTHPNSLGARGVEWTPGVSGGFTGTFNSLNDCPRFINYKIMYDFFNLDGVLTPSQYNPLIKEGYNPHFILYNASSVQSGVGLFKLYNNDGEYNPTDLNKITRSSVKLVTWLSKNQSITLDSNLTTGNLFYTEGFTAPMIKEINYTANNGYGYISYTIPLINSFLEIRRKNVNDRKESIVEINKQKFITGDTLKVLNNDGTYDIVNFYEYPEYYSVSAMSTSDKFCAVNVVQQGSVSVPEIFTMRFKNAAAFFACTPSNTNTIYYSSTFNNYLIWFTGGDDPQNASTFTTPSVGGRTNIKVKLSGESAEGVAEAVRRAILTQAAFTGTIIRNGDTLTFTNSTNVNLTDPSVNNFNISADKLVNLLDPGVYNFMINYKNQLNTNPVKRSITSPIYTVTALANSIFCIGGYNNLSRDYYIRDTNVIGSPNFSQARYQNDMNRNLFYKSDIEIYRSIKNDNSLFYLVKTIEQNRNFSLTDFVRRDAIYTFVFSGYYNYNIYDKVSACYDNLKDITIQSNRTIYTTGGIIDNGMVGPCSSVISFSKKLAVVNKSDNSMRYSKDQDDQLIGAPSEVGFPEEFYITVNDNSELMSINFFFNNIVLFTKENIFYVSGEGADNFGLGGFGQVNKLLSDVACTDVNSVIQYNEGIVFKSYKGYHLIGGGLGAPVYIGKNIEKFNDWSIYHAVVHPNRKEVLFSISDSFYSLNSNTANKILVYNYFFKKWSVFDIKQFPNNPDVIDNYENKVYQFMISYNNERLDYVENGSTPVFGYYNEFGQPALEGTYGDFKENLSLIYQTPYIKLKGISDYQRISRALLGLKVNKLNWVSGPKTINLTIDIYYDYNDISNHQVTYPLSVNFDSVSNEYLWKEIGLIIQNQKCESISFKVTADATSDLGLLYDIEFVNLNLTVGIKSGSNKKPKDLII